MTVRRHRWRLHGSRFFTLAIVSQHWSPTVGDFVVLVETLASVSQHWSLTVGDFVVLVEALAPVSLVGLVVVKDGLHRRAGEHFTDAGVVAVTAGPAPGA